MARYGTPFYNHSISYLFVTVFYIIFTSYLTVTALPGPLYLLVLRCGSCTGIILPSGPLRIFLPIYFNS